MRRFLGLARQKGFTLIELLMCLWVLLWLSAVIGFVWIIIHFVTKFW